MRISPQIEKEIQYNSSQSPRVFHETNKLVLKCIWKKKVPHCQDAPEELCGGTHHTSYQDFHTPTVIMTLWYWPRVDTEASGIK